MLAICHVINANSKYNVPLTTSFNEHLRSEKISTTLGNYRDCCTIIFFSFSSGHEHKRWFDLCVNPCKNADRQRRQTGVSTYCLFVLPALMFVFTHSLLFWCVNIVNLGYTESAWNN